MGKIILLLRFDGPFKKNVFVRNWMPSNGNVNPQFPTKQRRFKHPEMGQSDVNRWCYGMKLGIHLRRYGQ
jgi:hypothetical protein